jgi:hypothetical protein
LTKKKSTIGSLPGLAYKIKPGQQPSSRSGVKMDPIYIQQEFLSVFDYYLDLTFLDITTEDIVAEKK